VLTNKLLLYPMASYSWKDITKDESLIYKGVGILLIVFHNFFHNIKPTVGENEFGFAREHFTNLLTFLADTPDDLVRHLFSYFGHYGVQIFIFLSAYGISRSYGGKKISFWGILKPRLLRLYSAFLVALFFHAIATEIISEKGFELWYIKAYLWKLALIYNFMPGQALALNGPWWFVSFIAQFYFAFPLIDALIDRFGLKSLLVLSVLGVLVNILLNPILEPHGLNLLFTVFGYFPEFSLGIYLARARAVNIPAYLITGAGAVFILSNWFKEAWYFASPVVTLLLLIALNGFVPKLNKTGLIWRILNFYGYISLPLFLIHGFIRPPFVDAASSFGNWNGNLTCAVAFLAATTLLSCLALALESLGYKLAQSIGQAKIFQVKSRP